MNQLATGSEDTHIRIWNTLNWELMKYISVHIKEVWSLSYSPDM